MYINKHNYLNLDEGHTLLRYINDNNSKRTRYSSYHCKKKSWITNEILDLSSRDNMMKNRINIDYIFINLINIHIYLEKHEFIEIILVKGTS